MAKTAENTVCVCMTAIVSTTIPSTAEMNKKHSDSDQAYRNLGHQIIMVSIIFMTAFKVPSLYITSADDLSKMGKTLNFFLSYLFLPLSPYIFPFPYYL